MTISADPRFPKTPLNGCARCHRDFANLRSFDQHLISPDDGWCMDVESDPDWLLDRKGRWTTEKRLAQAEGARRRLISGAKAHKAPEGVS